MSMDTVFTMKGYLIDCQTEVFYPALDEHLSNDINNYHMY